MLSIIITHHKTPVLLKLCLKSIKENIGELEYETIIGDSESDREVRAEIQEKFPAIKFITFKKNIGYAKIVNAGLELAKGEYILILNADIIILKGAIERLLNFLKERPLVGLVGPQLLTFTNKVQDSCFHFPTLGAILARRTFLGKLKWGRKKIEEFVVRPMWDTRCPTSNVGHRVSHMGHMSHISNMAVDWVQGSAMMVRRSAVEKVGLLDERFFMYLEDADWCRRFWQNGFEGGYLPTAQMDHYYYRSSQSRGGLFDLLFNRYARIHLISAFKYFWKWRGIKLT